MFANWGLLFIVYAVVKSRGLSVFSSTASELSLFILFLGVEIMLFVLTTRLWCVVQTLYSAEAHSVAQGDWPTLRAPI